MPKKTSPFINSNYGWGFGESGWNDGMDDNILQFSYLFDSNIDGIVENLPPFNEGEAYYSTPDKRVYFAADGLWKSTELPLWHELKGRTDGSRWLYNGTGLTPITDPAVLEQRVDSTESAITELVEDLAAGLSSPFVVNESTIADSSGKPLEDKLNQREKSGQSFVDRLLNSTRIKNMYVIHHPTPTNGQKTFGIGLNFSGTDNPAVEYQFGQDSQGWWRLFGAFSGYTRQDIGVVGYEPQLLGTYVFATNTTSTYTVTVGDKFRTAFQGETLQFTSNQDNRGGIWRFRIDGELVGDFSTYSATSGIFTQTIKTGLNPSRIYNVVAEFMGSDPVNPPSGGTARGWLVYKPTANEYPNGQRAISDGEASRVLDFSHARAPRAVMSQMGINEFAFKVKEVGSELPATWVPYHNGEAIVENITSKLYVDGIDTNPTTLTVPRRIDSFVIEQSFTFKQGGGSQLLGVLNTRHSISRASGKMSFDWKVFSFQPIEVSTWYGAQFMTDYSVCNRLVLNDGQSFKLSTLAEDSSTNVSNYGVTSAAFVGISSSTAQVYHGAAIDVNPVYANALNKSPVRPATPLLLTKRSADQVAKIYWRAADTYSMAQEETIFGSVTWAAVTGIRTPNNLDIEVNGALI